MTTNEPIQKTSEQIEDLKRKWLKDPIWDIEETEGYEAHKQDLLGFRLHVEAAEKARVAEVEARRKIMTFIDDVTFGSRMKGDDEISVFLGQGWTIANVSIVVDNADGDQAILRITTLTRS